MESTNSKAVYNTNKASEKKVTLPKGRKVSKQIILFFLNMVKEAL